MKKLTKPQLVLDWMITYNNKFYMVDGVKRIALFSSDRDALIEYGGFKDSKALSNALYMLHKDDFIFRIGDVWVMTPAGEEYIEEILMEETHDSINDVSNEDEDDENLEEDNDEEDVDYANDAYVHAAEALRHAAEALKIAADVFNNLGIR